MILILNDERHDPDAEVVVNKLRDRGADPVVFDYGRFPAQAQISVLYDDSREMRFVVRSGGRIIDLNNAQAVWLRRPTGVPLF